VANTITDNRTVLFVAKTSAPASETWEASGGGGSATEDDEIFIEGDTSIAEQISDSIRVLLWDNGTTQDLSNGHIYIWANCGVVGLLETKANAGFTVRLTGPTSANFVEWEVGGSDSWPTAILGGWVMFVVDTASTPSNTGGTPPALTAIQKVGISAQTVSMTRAADNTWVDAGWFLPDATPGIIIEGRNGGSTDWTFADINTELGDAAGMFVQGEGGAWVCNAPIQFGVNDTVTHAFTDTNQVILWSDQEHAASDLYKLSALGNSGGTTNVTMGIKTGTGDDATGAQGCIFKAATGGVRWDMDFDDPDVDGVNMYGCLFIHGGAFVLDDAAVLFISSAYLDCTSALVSNSEQLRCSVIDANTADDEPFMTTDDMGDLVFCSFEFSDGHGVGLTTPRVASQSSKGNSFLGYGAIGTTDAAIENDTGGAVEISTTSGASVAEHTYQNGSGASTTVTGAVAITVTPIVTGSEVRAYLTGTGTEVDGIENSASTFHELTLVSGEAVDIVVHSYDPPREPIRVNNVSFTADQDFVVFQRLDRNFIN